MQIVNLNFTDINCQPVPANSYTEEITYFIHHLCLQAHGTRGMCPVMASYAYIYDC